MKAYKKFIIIMCIVASVSVVGGGDKAVNSDTKIQSDNIKWDLDEALNKLENEYVSYNISHRLRKSLIKVNDNTLSIIKTINEAVDIIVMPNQAGLEQISSEDYKVSVETALESQTGVEIYAKELNMQEVAAYYIEGNNLIIIDGKCTDGGRY